MEESSQTVCIKMVCNQLNPETSVRSRSFESIGIKVMKSARLIG